MNRSISRTSPRALALILALGLLLSGVVGTTGAGAHPGSGSDADAAAGPELDLGLESALAGGDAAEEEPAGVGVRVNEPAELEGFYSAVQWSGTAEVADQTADFAYAGTGCTPAHYAAVDADGKIALVDSFQGQDPGDECPTYTFKQKMDAAETAGAIGLVQISADDELTAGDAIDSGIPGLEISNTDGVPIREAVRDDTTVNATLTIEGAELIPTERLSDVRCEGGQAGPFECDGIDLLSFVPMDEFDGDEQSDLWGWTDPETGDEYVIIGKMNGVGFFRVTDPTDPEYLGELPNPALLERVWHDIKVYDDHAFIVSESEPHGMSVFDLTRLRDVAEPQEFDRDAFYPLHSAAHNVEVNTETGFAYIVGGNAGIVVPDHCLSGLHIVDVNEPTNPTFAGCYAQDGGPGTAARTVGGPVAENSPAAYVHDTQCVIYDGPDERYQGREICVNSSETHVAIADVTDKQNPQTIAVAEYPHTEYTHQGWLTEDHAHFILGDELDERDNENVENTRMVLFDLTDLEDAHHIADWHFDTVAITHNLYVHEGLAYHSNYSSGLRVTDTAPIADGRLEEIAFFDTYPIHSDTTFDGTWSNYPFFESGTIAVSGRQEGLFLLRLQEETAEEGPDQPGPPFGPPDERPPEDRPPEGRGPGDRPPERE